MNNTTDKDRALAYALRESVAQGLMDKAVQLIAQHREEAVREYVTIIKDLIKAHNQVYENERWACMEQAVERAIAAMKGTT